MRSALFSFFLALLCACQDNATQINIAPSAVPKSDDIIAAAERLNDIVGEHAYHYDFVDSEKTVDHEVIVHLVADVKYADAITRHRTFCTVIDLEMSDSQNTIAHEMGHAAGLHHVNDPHNLMDPNGDGWELTHKQIETILEAR